MRRKPAGSWKNRNNQKTIRKSILKPGTDFRFSFAVFHPGQTGEKPAAGLLKALNSRSVLC
uniref:Uncharacterized protein n=1 Tax=Faecalibaculum rodentium TaxID=1702221 RepID=A0A140DS64_9FIRM|nr:hypothetical protein AALO17_03570 [Faecalibaculum rodentium]